MPTRGERPHREPEEMRWGRRNVVARQIVAVGAVVVATIGRMDCADKPSRNTDHRSLSSLP